MGVTISEERDARLDAALTLYEINKLLIDAVLEHNSSIFDSLAGQTNLLIASGLAPTPLNYWNVHVQKHRHALSQANEANVRARLLPIEWVSMTSKGLRLNDEMYYETDHSDFEDWKVLARAGNSWRLEARIDQDNSSFIYVRFKSDEGFSRSWLRKASGNFNERHQADILLFEDWKKLEKNRAKPTAKSIERHQRRKAITRNAQKEAASAPPLKSKVERIKGMEERRKQAILDARISGENADELHAAQHQVEIDQRTKERKRNVLSLLKRKKDRNE